MRSIVAARVVPATLRGPAAAFPVVVAALGNLAIAATVLTRWGTGPDGTELALRTTARVSLVWFLLAFLATPAARLWPGRVTTWLVRQRGTFGVVFGLSMSIHVACILRLFYLFAPERPPMVNTADFTIGIPGLVLVALMTITSITVIRRAVGPVAWDRLHRTGLWVVWSIFVLCLIDSVSRKTTAHPVLAYHVFITLLVGAAMLRLVAARRPRVIPGAILPRHLDDSAAARLSARR